MFTLFTKVQYILHFTSLIFFSSVRNFNLVVDKTAELSTSLWCSIWAVFEFHIYTQYTQDLCITKKKNPKSINHFSSVVFFMLGIYTHIYYVLGIISPMFWTTAVVCGRASNFDWKKHTQKLARFPNRGHVFYIDSILIFKICIAILNQIKKKSK